MTRPLYESKSDLAVERSLAARIQNNFSWSLKKLSRRYELDFIAFAGKKAVAFIEVKRRHNPVHHYETIILSLAKYIKGAQYQKTTGLKFLFIVEFDDGCFQYTYNENDGKDFKITMGGRTDRNDPEDIEPVIHIPVSKMTPLFDTTTMGDHI